MVGWDPAARAICEAEVGCDRLDCVCQILCPFRVRARLGRFSLQDVTQRAAQVEVKPPIRCWTAWPPRSIHTLL